VILSTASLSSSNPSTYAGDPAGTVHSGSEHSPTPTIPTFNGQSETEGVIETRKGVPGSMATFPNGLKDVHEMSAAAEALRGFTTDDQIRVAERTGQSFSFDIHRIPADGVQWRTYSTLASVGLVGNAGAVNRNVNSNDTPHLHHPRPIDRYHPQDPSPAVVPRLIANRWAMAKSRTA
jgi:hypothetical protein